MRMLRSPSGGKNGNQGEATYSDSTAVYEGAVRSKEFYDSLMDYYRDVATYDKNNNKYAYDAINKSMGGPEWINPSTIAGLKNTLGNIQRYVTNGILSQSEADSLKKLTEKNIQEVSSLNDPNKALISDLVTGLIDPQAPLVLYDKRIEPQSFKQYMPKLPINDFADAVGQEAYDTKGISYDPAFIVSAIKEYKEGDESHLKVIADKIGISYPEFKARAEEAINKDNEVERNLLGNVTKIPYYDPVMVKPFADLTDDERKVRIEKALETGQTGGIPESVIQQAKKQPTQQSKNSTAPKPPQRPKNMSKMQSIAASEVPNEMPYRVVKGEVKPVTTGRAPQPIMRLDPTSPTNQYQVGELMWDKDKKKWVRDMWDKEDQRASRSLQRDMRSEQRNRANRKYRIIKAPKF